MFNEQYAQQVYDDLASRDPDEAEMLALFTVYDVIHDDIAANQRTLNNSRDAILKSMREDLAPVLTKRADDQSLIAAALLSVVSKSSDGWKEELHPRNKAGRFRRAMGQAAGEKHYVRSYTNDKGKKVVERKTEYNAPGSLSHNSGFHRGTDEFSRRIDEMRNEDSPAGRVYGRMEAGGKVLGAVGRATGNPGLAAAGHTAQFAGMYGPQAERVVGDSMRRNTYRFRGTERKVDNQLQQAALSKEKDFARNEGVAMNQLSPEMRAEAGRQAAVGYLMTRLPKKGLSQLHQETGRIPPSEGVIIDAHGDITKQSVGYMEDHYLPFNLANLKQLRGGQYVRTRSTGGPTSEDISAATLAGARSLTVVSRSGVFTIDLADDLKGGRRYNDKVKQMTGQYQKALKAVDSGKVRQRNISPSEKADIRSDVEDEMGGWSTPADREAEYQRRVTEFASKPQLTKDELSAVDRRARTIAHDSMDKRDFRLEANDRPLPFDEEKRYRILRNEFTEREMADRQATNYQLDGHGYGAAMDSLKEQFPYFIQDTNWHALRDPERGVQATERDNAHVERGRLRPFVANQRVKLSQGAKQSQPETSSTGANTESVETQSEPKKPMEAHQKLKMAETQRKMANDALTKATNALRAVNLDADTLKAQLAASPAAQKLFDKGADGLSTDERKGAADHLVNIASALRDNADNNKEFVKDQMLKAAENIENAVKEFRGISASTGVGVKEMKRDDTEYGTPISFEGGAFEPGHTPDQYAKQYAMRAKNASLPEDPNGVDDDLLKGRSAHFANLAKYAEKRASGNYDPNDALIDLHAAASKAGFHNSMQVASDLQDKLSGMSEDEAKQMASNAWDSREQIEQMRTLKKLHQDHGGGGGNAAGGHLTAITSSTAAPMQSGPHQIEPVRTRSDLLLKLMGAAKATHTSEDDRELMYDMIHQVRLGDMEEAAKMSDHLGDGALKYHVKDLHDSYLRNAEDEDY